MPGLVPFLDWAEARGLPVACLSNDVGDWSRKLRERFRLDGRIGPWFISGELGARKPAPDIYRHALAGLGVAPQSILCVDGRAANVAAAQALGMQGLLFDATAAVPEDALGSFRQVATAAER